MKKLKLFILTSLMIGALSVGAGCSEKDTLAKPTDVTYNIENELTWTPVDEARSYLIEIVSVDTGEVQTLSAKRTSPKVSLGYLAQGDYEIRVKALGREGQTEGEWSQTVYFKKGYETGCVYTLINNDTEYAISKFGSSSGTIYIEDEYRGKPVTEISARAFKGYSEIEYVYVGDNVKRINDNAFYNCKNLKGVYFDEESALEHLGVGAFQSCALLEEITIPKGVTALYDSAFAYCRSLKKVVLHDEITAIDAFAFSDCSALTSLEIPDSVTYLGGSAFMGCTGLKSLKLGEGLSQISTTAFYKCTALEEIEFPKKGNLTAIGAGAFSECTALTSLVIPTGVEDIGQQAFSMTVDVLTGNEEEQIVQVNSKLASIEIPNTVTHVGQNAFFGTKLYMDAYLAKDATLIYVDDWLVAATVKAKAETVELHADDFQAGVYGIADVALSGFSLLEKVYLPASVKYIGNSAFRSNLKLNEFTAEPQSVVSIGKYAFASCQILKIVIFGDGVKTIGEGAFAACERLSNKVEDNVIVPDTVESIANNAFIGTKLESEADKYGVIYAGNWIVGCDKNSSKVEISADAIGIATYAFARTKVSQITIPNKNNLSYVMRGAFYKCERLDMVDFSRTNVREIGDYAFYSCTSLSRIDLPRNLVKIGKSVFSQCGQLGSVNFDDLDKLESIGASAFFECINLETIEFGASLKEIGRAAFYKCNSLEEVNIPGSVKHLGDYAFARCELVEKVTIGRQVEKIGNYAFANCEALKRVSIAEGVKSVGDYAFYGCQKLVILKMQEGLENIGAHAFSGANNLIELTLPSTLKTIGVQAFRGCASLTYVMIPASVETIAEHAFYGCITTTFYVEEGAVMDAWNKQWNSTYRPIVWGCTFSEDGQHVVSLTVGEASLANTWAQGGFTAPEKAGFTFAGWATAPDGEVVYDANDIVNASVGTTLYAIWQ